MRCGTTGIVVFTFLAGLLTGQVKAQSPHPPFRHYTSDQGLPSSEVYEALQDRQGFIWFGTDNGVSRFNGYEFENFGPEQGLMDNVVFYLHEDHWGRIWMVTMSERLYYYDYRADSIIAYPYNDLIRRQRPENMGWPGFYVDSAQTVYRSFPFKGILRIDRNGRHNWLPEDRRLNGRVGITVEGTPVLSDKGPDTFTETLPGYTTDSIQFFFKTGKNWKKTLVRAPINFRVATDYYYRLSDGSLLLSAASYLFLFKEDSLLWFRPEPDFKVTAALQTSTGSIMLGGDQRAGLRAYSSLEDLRLGKYSLHNQGQTVSHILEDRTGGYWVTTTQEGVFYIPSLAPVIYDTTSGLPDHDIVAIAAESADILWMALRTGDLIRLDHNRFSVTRIPRFWGKEIFDLIWDDQQQRLWLGGNRTYSFLPYSKAPSMERIAIASSIDATGKKLVMSPGALHVISGFSFLRADRRNMTLTFDYWKASKRAAIREKFTALYEDSRGRLWVGKLDGLFYLRDSALHRPSNLPPPLKLRVEDIKELPDGTLVFGTKGAGIVLWKDNSYEVIGTPEGLTSGMVECLHIDQDRHIWVGTLNGLNQIEKNPSGTWSVKTFTMANGLPSNEINDIESWGGNLWVATRRGLIRLLQRLRAREESPAPLITEILVNGRKKKAASLGSLYSRENTIQLSFLTLNYSLNGNINYRYRLEPSGAWTYSRERQVHFQALAPGNYRFVVQSQNEDGLWSRPATRSFSIARPLWQKKWFVFSVIILATGSAYMVYRRRLMRLKREGEVYRETQRLKQSALRAQMNPHFLFNCLNAIQNAIAQNDREKALHFLSRFAKLVRGALNASMAERVRLEDDIQLLENYLALEKMRFHDKFDYQIDVPDSVDPFETTVPPMLIQPYVENAVIHGLQKMSAGGQIYVRFARQNGILTATVEDNGIGITAGLANSDRAESHKGVGMTITRQRLELLLPDGGEQVSVTELKDENGRPAGTCVTVRIPV